MVAWCITGDITHMQLGFLTYGLMMVNDGEWRLMDNGDLFFVSDDDSWKINGWLVNG